MHHRYHRLVNTQTNAHTHARTHARTHTCALTHTVSSIHTHYFTSKYICVCVSFRIVRRPLLRSSLERRGKKPSDWSDTSRSLSLPPSPTPTPIPTPTPSPTLTLTLFSTIRAGG